MLTIRFQRVGKRNSPSFRIVVTERRSKPKSGEREIVGSFNPKTKETRINRERVLYCLAHGAKASPRVHNLLVTEGIITGAKINVVRRPLAVPAPAGPEAPTAGTPAGAAGETTAPSAA